MKTCKLTMGQATIEFLKKQYVERDGIEHQFFAGMFGIFWSWKRCWNWTGFTPIL